MKKEYEKPEIEITEFEVEDIIAYGLSVRDDGTGDELGWGDIY